MKQTAILPRSTQTPKSGADYALTGATERAALRRVLLDHAVACDLAGMPGTAAIAIALADGPIELAPSGTEPSDFDPGEVLARIFADVE